VQLTACVNTIYLNINHLTALIIMRPSLRGHIMHYTQLSFSCSIAFDLF